MFSLPTLASWLAHDTEKISNRQSRDGSKPPGSTHWRAGAGCPLKSHLPSPCQLQSPASLQTNG